MRNQITTERIWFRLYVRTRSSQLFPLFCVLFQIVTASLCSLFHTHIQARKARACVRRKSEVKMSFSRLWNDELLRYLNPKYMYISMLVSGIFNPFTRVNISPPVFFFKVNNTSFVSNSIRRGLLCFFREMLSLQQTLPFPSSVCSLPILYRKKV